MISLAQLLGRPVRNAAPASAGSATSWSAGTPGSRIRRSLGVLIRVGSGFAFVERADVTLRQTEVGLRSAQQTVSRPVRQPGDVALARDVLDRQLVDVAGVQVVRAADVTWLTGLTAGNSPASMWACGRSPAG